MNKINTILTRVKITDKLFFTKNLSLLIKSGIPLAQSMESLAEQTENLKLQNILWDVNNSIQKGESLAQALSPHKNVFSEIFINMIQAGEESGTVDEVLKTLTLQLEKEHNLRSKVIGALIYPVVVLGAMLSITTGLIVFVIPKLSRMFVEAGLKLPLPTRILIGLSNFLSHYFYLVIFLIIGIAIGFWQFKKMYFGKKILHKLILKFPIISKIVIKIYLAQISRTLYSVLKTDIPVVQAFLLSSKVINNIYYKNVLEKVANNLKEGANIHESLEKYGGHNKSGCLFPATMIQMISVGETTGSLDNILEETAKFYEEEVNNTLEHLPALLEPILILLLGITVGGIAISIMLPIFSLTQGVENM